MRSMPRARPVSGSTSTTAAANRGSPLAVSKRWASRQKRSRMISFSTPITRVRRARHAEVGHERRALRKQAMVARGDVGVGAEERREATPSKKWPSAVFSELASPWTSTRITFASARSFSTGRLAARERVVDRTVHEDPAAQVQRRDRDAPSASRGPTCAPRPGCRAG